MKTLTVRVVAECCPKKTLTYVLLFFATIGLIGCSLITTESPTLSLHRSQAANPYTNPYQARSYPGKLEIFKGDKRVSIILSEKPNIQRWGFIDSGHLLIVKSRGETGPAVFELFDVTTGILRSNFLEHDAQKIWPLWATTF